MRQLTELRVGAENGPFRHRSVPKAPVVDSHVAAEEVMSEDAQPSRRFEILHLLGKGGMGDVYLAYDSVLERQVALKFMPTSSVESSEARQRFLREAKAAAALDHPFICKIFEIGTIDGRDFIAMEYVRGETLRSRLDRGPIPTREACQIALEITEALEAAGRAKIIHRDLKPSNLILTDDSHVKVLDFGLAKHLPKADQVDSGVQTYSELTVQGGMLGTVPYMSPEQTRGLPLDQRSDLFSFGVVFFEMLTGQHPFRKEIAVDTAIAIIKEPTPRLDRFLAEASDLLEETVSRLLAKKPDERYQSADEVRARLHELLEDGVGSASRTRVVAPRRSRSTTWKAGVGLAVAAIVALVGSLVTWTTLPWRTDPSPGLVTSIDSLAVLPVRSALGGPSDEAYLLDGLTDGLVSSLAQIGALRVISRTSVMGYRNTTLPAPEIARELSVDALIEATVLHEDEHLTLTVQLVDGSSGTIFWNQTFADDFSRVQSLHRQTARAVAEAIEIQLTAQEEARLAAAAASVSPQIYTDYLKGRYYLVSRTSGEFAKAEQYFRSAIRQDAEFAPALAGLGEYHMLMGYYYSASHEAFPRARSATLRALELDSDLGQAYGTLGMIRFLYDWDWKAAEEAFQRGIALEPDSGLHFFYSLFLNAQGRHEEAGVQVALARQLDPLEAGKHNALGMHFLLSRRYEEAIDSYTALLETYPNFALGRTFLALSYLEKEEYQRAIDEFRRTVDIVGRPTPVVLRAALGLTYGHAGQVEEAQAILDELMQEARDSFVAPPSIATVLMGLGRDEEALDWLERGLEVRAVELVYLGTHPKYDPLRGNRRFDRLMERMKLKDAAYVSRN